MSCETPSSTSSSAAEEIGQNDDLLLEILILLPAMYLIRYKSVSKHWHSLISAASFSHLHTLRHRKQRTSFLLRASPSHFFHFNPTSKKFVPFRFNFAHADIRQSCNGLLLLECGQPHGEYYVYNPTTGESRNLLLNPDMFWGIFLVFDPSKSPHYKVICLRSTSHTMFLIETDVYDSETHTWRQEGSRPSNAPPPLLNWVYSENCIYTLVCDGSVCCYDIEKLKFRTRPLDVGLRSGGLRIIQIIESGGLVHYIAHDDAINHLVLVEIKECGCEWSLKRVINFNYVATSFRAITQGKVCFLGVLRGDRQEECLVFHAPGKIMVFHFYGMRFEELLDLKELGFYKEGILQFGYHDTYQFVESLAPV